MNGENRDVDRIDEVAGDASRHRLLNDSVDAVRFGCATFHQCVGAVR
jgi:hypothetical protein